MKYSIGTKFIPNRKVKIIHTVVDFNTTYNIMGELVKERYVTSHDMCGQKVYNDDVVQTTIDMSTIIDGHDNNKENE